MSQRLFTAELGYSIDDLAEIVSSNGAPTADRPLGSLALDYTNGKVYIKSATGSGADKWAETSTGGDVTGLATEDGYIRSFIGKNAAGSETPDYGAAVEYVGQNVSLEAAVTALDAGLAKARHVTTNAAVTTAVALDSVLVDSYDMVRWLVHAKDNSGAVRVVEVIATHDGTTTTDATNVDYASYGKLKIGTMAGFAVTVSLTGATTAQVMRVMVESTSAVAVKVMRTAV